MEKKKFSLKSHPGLIFAGKTIFYFLILLALVYLYHYKHVGGGNFIYNEF